MENRRPIDLKKPVDHEMHEPSSFTRVGIVMVTHEEFPKLFANRPDLITKEQKWTNLFTARFERQNPKWTKTIDMLMEKKPSLEELHEFSFKTFYYPSTEILEISPDEKEKIRKEGSEWWNLVETFYAKELKPDLNAEEKKLISDPKLPIYLAIQLATGQLINPHTGKPFETVKELNEQLNKHDVSAQPVSISNRLLDLPKEKTVREFIEKGWISENELENYFKNIAIWSTLLSLSQILSTHNKEVSPILPFIADPPQYQPLGKYQKTAPPDEDLYKLEYLPYLVSAMHEYVLFLPDILPSGHVYPPSYIETATQKLSKLCKETIRLKRENYEAEKVKSITVIIQYELASLRKVLDEFGRNQELWNKKEGEKTESTEANVTNLRSIMDDIRDFGGRVPSHLSIKKKFEIKKGKI